ncbi:hypothetical protein AWENTII_000225 [Aspergillus wentii]
MPLLERCWSGVTGQLSNLGLQNERFLAKIISSIIYLPDNILEVQKIDLFSDVANIKKRSTIATIAPAFRMKGSISITLTTYSYLPIKPSIHNDINKLQL